MPTQERLLDPEERVESTRVLSQVFEAFNPADGLKILDLGSAEPESIAFYSRVGGQICVLDTVNQLSSRKPYSLIRELPRQAKDMRFDICLLWDCLNYLDGRALMKFGMELSAHIHRHTRAHAIAAYTPTRAFRSYRYGLLNVQNLIIKSRNQLTPHSHPKTKMDKALIGLRTTQTLLRAGNRLEMMLVTSFDAEAGSPTRGPAPT